MAGGRKRDGRRATMSPYENFYRYAVDGPSVPWVHCGLQFVASVWETAVDHELSPERLRAFRARLEARELAGLAAEDVEDAANQTLALNPNKQLLLTEWRETAVGLARLRFALELERRAEEADAAQEDERIRRAGRKRRDEAQIAHQRASERARARLQSLPRTVGSPTKSPPAPKES